MFEQLLTTALHEIEASRPVLLVSVARATGSTPRKEGAMMLAGTQRLLCGTIGGGLLEHRCLSLAAVQPAHGHLEHFELDNRKAGSLGMVCGGSTEVLFTPLTDFAPLRAALTALQNSSPAWLCLPLDGSAPHIAQDSTLPPRPTVLSLHGKDSLCVPLTDAGRVFVIGGGHVSHELCALLHRLDFRHIVIDDRVDFCSPTRFPHAEHTLTVPLNELAETLNGTLYPTEADAFCIMTRGHEGDADAVRYALSTSASYIGLMGSRRKRETLFYTLTQEGFSDAAQRRIVTPIGLEIGAQTPAEIAVSIAAQLIKWRAAR